jgi:hypothetical protein
MRLGTIGRNVGHFYALNLAVLVAATRRCVYLSEISAKNIYFFKSELIRLKSTGKIRRNFGHFFALNLAVLAATRRY